ncbi:MAG: carboxypeptidase-like regulatory domain-containing protein [Candidatus Berkelbacteria bacterium]|nr:carboxypeptidase-like regulatory domain-containing protein [Candidatus Berkelbacteria bacterium]
MFADATYTLIPKLNLDFSSPIDINSLFKIDITSQDLQNHDGIYYKFKEIDFDDNMAIDVSVNDENGPLPKSTVEVSSQGCSVLRSKSQMTNNDGETNFLNADLLWFFTYLRLPGSKCLPYIDIKVSKNGYITKVLNYDVENLKSDSFRVNGQVSIGVTLQKTKPDQKGIIGTVLDADKKPIEGADVYLWRDKAIGLPLYLKHSDSSGGFEFGDITGGNYIVSSFHKDYLSTENSRRFIKLRTGEAQELELVMTSYPHDLAENIYSLPVTAFERETQTLVSDLSVEFDQGGKSEKVSVNSGRLYINVKPGALRVKATRSNETLTSQVEIPSDFNALSDTDKQNIYDKLTFYFSNLSHDTVDRQIIKVLDQKNQPVANAQVVFSYNDILPFFLSGKMAGQTNNNGIINLPNDFQYVDINDLPIAMSVVKKITQFKLGLLGTLSLKVKRPDSETIYPFTEQVKGADKNYEIILKIPVLSENSSATSHSINVQIADLIKWASASADDLKPLYLEKKTGKNWERVQIQPSIQEESILNGLYKKRFKSYPHPEKGIYRARMEGSDYISEEKVFDDKDDLGFSINGCVNNGNYHKVDYPGNIFFVMGSGEYTAYQNNAARKKLFDKIAGDLLLAKNHSVDVGPLVVIWTGDMIGINAFMTDPVATCMGVNNARPIKFTSEFLALAEKGNMDYIISPVVIHEYGHQVYEVLKTQNPDFYNRWVDLFKNIKGSQNSCVWDRLKEGNIWSNYVGLGGHPDDDYGGTLPGHEMFASMYSSYFSINFHNRLLSTINNYSSGECQNTLAYMWTLFSENVGELVSGDKIAFQPYGGGVNRARYSFSQIKSGAWRADRFGDLGLSGQVSVMYQKFIAPLGSSTRTAAIEAKLAIINKFIDLKTTGRPKGNIEGVVVDNQNLKVRRAIVKIGQKYAVTDDSGRFSIIGIAEGSQNISSIILFNTGGSYLVQKPAGKKIVIQKDKTVFVNIKVDK